MLDPSTLTDLQLRAEIARVEHQCERIVASVHGVIPLALAETRERLMDEADARNYLAEQDARLDYIFGD